MKTLIHVCLLICAMMALTGAAGIPKAQVKWSSNCPQDWTEISGRCFHYVPSSKTWQQAEGNCWTMGAKLASVHSFAEYDGIQSMIARITHKQTEAWLGGSDIYKEGVWVWSDGSRFDFSHWCPGEPNNLGNNQHCLQMNYSSSKCWDDLACNTKRASVCAKKTE